MKKHLYRLVCLIMVLMGYSNTFAQWDSDSTYVSNDSTESQRSYTLLVRAIPGRAYMWAYTYDPTSDNWEMPRAQRRARSEAMSKANRIKHDDGSQGSVEEERVESFSFYPGDNVMIEVNTDYNYVVERELAEQGISFAKVVNENATDKERSQNRYTLVMPSHDVEISLYIVYDPELPKQPVAAEWDPQTGTLFYESINFREMQNDIMQIVGGYDNMGLIKNLTITGQMSPYGLEIYGYQNVVSLDISNTKGVTRLERWDIESMAELQTIKLPATLKYVGTDAFSSNVMSVTIYATTPPEVENNELFYENEANPNLVIYVPVEAMSEYIADPVWGQYTIMPIGSDVPTQSIKLMFDNYNNLGADVYEGCKIKVTGEGVNLEATMDGENMTYVINGIPQNSCVDVVVENIYGQQIQCMDSVFVYEADAMLMLGLPTLTTVPVNVYAGGQDVTDRCEITVTDNEGNFITHDSLVKQQDTWYNYIHVFVTPKDSTLANYAAADSLFRVELGTNGLFIELKAKETGIKPGAYHAVITMCKSEKPVAAVLFNKAGIYIRKDNYTVYGDLHAETSVGNLEPDNYVLLTAIDNPLLDNLYSLSQIQSLGFVAGRDYLINEFTVESDRTTEINNNFFVDFDVVNQEYLNTVGAYTANKTELAVGSSISFKASVKFNEEWLYIIQQNLISNAKVTFDFDKQIRIYDNSVVNGTSIVPYVFQGKTLTVPLNMQTISAIVNAYASNDVRFSLIPLEEGTYNTTAKCSFTYRGEEINVDLGTLTFEATGFHMNAQERTGKPSFHVNGTGIPFSQATIYDTTGFILGFADVNGLGEWKTSATLWRPEAGNTYSVYAMITTPDSLEYKTNVCDVLYNPEFANTESVSMKHFNEWSHTHKQITWDYAKGTPSNKFYEYFHGARFTFTAKLSNSNPIHRLFFYVKTSNRKEKTLEGQYNPNTDQWTATEFFDTNEMPTNVCVDFTYKDDGEADDSTSVSRGHTYTCTPVNPIADPSGFVYEAVKSNRLQGVTATAYYKENDDDYGMIWNAEDYDQMNPLITDEMGVYSWDVPNGLWQVRFFKDGYDYAETEWLPVPPPQIEINVPMVSYVAPKVASVNAYEDGVEIIFDKYMTSSTLTKESISLIQNGEAVDGYITLLDNEQENNKWYATRLRFVTAQPLLAGKVTVEVNNSAKSYAGVALKSTFSQDFTITKEITSLTAGDETTENPSVNYAGQTTFIVQAMPADAAAGKQVTVTPTDASILDVASTTATFDAQGVAVVTVKGVNEGSSAVRCSIEGTTLEAWMTMTVNPQPMQVAATPTAVETDGKLTLSCETANAWIYYTTDGTDPAQNIEGRKLYNGSAVEFSKDAEGNDITVKFIAMVTGMITSDMGTYSYSVPTTIKSVQNAENAADNKYYNVAGQRVNENNGKGVMINNHKKVTVK